MPQMIQSRGNLIHIQTLFMLSNFNSLGFFFVLNIVCVMVDMRNIYAKFFFFLKKKKKIYIKN